MKKHLLFVALATLFTATAFAAVKPETAPAAPTQSEEDVMALYSSHYLTNNLRFHPVMGGTEKVEVMALDGTEICYYENMTWFGMSGIDEPPYDLSAYEKLHFDVWVPQASHIKLTIESVGVNDGGSGYKHGVDFKLNEGWNTIDADPAWWNYKNDANEDVTYDWKDVKYVIFEGYTLDDDARTSAEGQPLAFANIYFWNTPAPKGMPEVAPEAPTMAEKNVQALFSATYQERTFNFAPTSWGSQWIDYPYENGQHIWFSESFGWDAFTNWDATSYDLNDYDMMHADIYVTVDSKMKITYEALGAGDGGSGWKNGGLVELKANQWNKVEVDLLNAPYDSFDFKDLRYMILEGFVKSEDGSSAEGTPLAIANVYFWNTMTPVDNISVEKVAVKRIVDGQLMIEANGKQFNAQGVQF